MFSVSGRSGHFVRRSMGTHPSVSKSSIAAPIIPMEIEAYRRKRCIVWEEEKELRTSFLSHGNGDILCRSFHSQKSSTILPLRHHHNHIRRHHFAWHVISSSQ